MSEKEAAIELKRSARAEYFNMINGPMFGEIEGIKFDLRHRDFPTDIELLAHELPGNEVLCSSLIFPWDFDFLEVNTVDPTNSALICIGDFIYTNSVRKLLLPQD